MAHFRATIKGNRGEVSRLGSKDSGIVASINGWDVGVRVEAKVTESGDKLRLFATRGSSNQQSIFLGTVLSQNGHIYLATENTFTKVI